MFTLVNKDFTVLTVGTPELYNSMIASWGGRGTLFDKPMTWSFSRSSRYILELVKSATVLFWKWHPMTKSAD